MQETIHPDIRRSVILTFLVLFGLAVLHALRFYEHFLHPALFAEEGAHYLRGWMTGKWHYIEGGYLNLFTFVLVALGCEISFTLLPFVLSAVAVFVAVISFCYFLLPQWERFLPFGYRLATVIFFLGFSPYVEGIAISEYAFWYFAVGAGFLTLELLYLPAQAAKHPWLKCIYAGTGALAGPAIFQVALPIFAIHFLFMCSEKGLRVALWAKLELIRKPLVLTMLLTGIVQITILLTHTEGQQSAKLMQFPQFFQAAIHQTQMRILVPTLLSNRLTGTINASPKLAMAAFTLLPFVFSIFLFQANTQRRKLAWLLLGAAFLSLCILYIGRGGLFDRFRFHVWNVELGGMRYSFIPGFFVITSLVFAFSNLRTLSLKRFYGAILIPLIIISGVFNYVSTEPGDDVGWFETAKQLREYRQGVRDTVKRPLVPRDWTIEIVRPR